MHFFVPLFLFLFLSRTLPVPSLFPPLFPLFLWKRMPAVTFTLLLHLQETPNTLDTLCSQLSSLSVQCEESILAAMDVVKVRARAQSRTCPCRCQCSYDMCTHGYMMYCRNALVC